MALTPLLRVRTGEIASTAAAAAAAAAATGTGTGTEAETGAGAEAETETETEAGAGAETGGAPDDRTIGVRTVRLATPATMDPARGR